MGTVTQTTTQKWSYRCVHLGAALLLQLDRLSCVSIKPGWQLTAIINGLPPFPTYAPAFEWLIAALRAHE